MRWREFFPDGGIGHVLIPGNWLGSTPIARTLHVILPAHRTNADVRATQIPGQQRRARQTANHINGLTKLGDAHPHITVADGAAANVRIA